MTVLRIVLDALFSAERPDQARYAAELARGLVRTAPDGCEVAGVIGSHPRDQVEAVSARLPGLSRLIELPASSTQLALAWELGIPPRMLSDGLTHAPTTLAPLFSHNRTLDPGVQTVVTVHSSGYWTHPEALTLRTRTRLARRVRLIERHADAVIVTRHSVAEVLESETSLGDRLQVIPASPTRHLVARGAVATKATELGYPARFLLASAAEPIENVRLIITALTRSTVSLPLLFVGATAAQHRAIDGVVATSELTGDRIRVLEHVSDDELSVLNTRATALVYLGDDAAIGLPLFDAMVARTPIIYPSTPDLLEVTGGAGFPVDISGSALVDELTTAFVRVTTDRVAAEHAAQEGADRARSFTWEDSARAVWNLHANL